MKFFGPSDGLGPWPSLWPPRLRARPAHLGPLDCLTARSKVCSNSRFFPFSSWDGGNAKGRGESKLGR